MSQNTQKNDVLYLTKLRHLAILNSPITGSHCYSDILAAIAKPRVQPKPYLMKVVR